MEGSAFACLPGGVALPSWNSIRGEFLQAPVSSGTSSAFSGKPHCGAGSVFLESGTPRLFIHNPYNSSSAECRNAENDRCLVMTPSPFFSLTSNTLSQTSTLRSSATGRQMIRRPAQGQGSRRWVVRHGYDTTALFTSARRATPIGRPSSTTSPALKSTLPFRILSFPRIPGGYAVVCSCS